MPKVEVIFMPTPGIGHLIPAVELAKRLVHEGGNHFSITILIMPYLASPTASTITSYIQSITSSGLEIRFEELPHPDPHHKENETFLPLFIEIYKPSVKNVIARHLSSPSSIPIAAIVLDLFCTSMIDVANEFGIPSYIYFTSTAASLGLMLYLPTLHVQYPQEFGDIKGEIDVPGLPPMPPLALPSPLMNKKDKAYNVMVEHGRKFREMKGIIVNTFAELEPNPLKELKEGSYIPDHPTPPVYPVGPLLRLERSKAGPGHECIKWLDEQPPSSVVFLCFGSYGCFGAPQVKEIALGLEKSGHRFLWSLRVPGKTQLPTDANLDEVLPEGFLERTKGMGMVSPSWVPQVEILSHGAVGGFVTHCGWNSCLESLWFGVPTIGWPLYAEQHMNAFQMARDLGVAVELKVDVGSGGFVKAEEVERGVRCSMEDCEEGKKARVRTKEMKVASRKAVEEGGSSSIALECLMGELTKGLGTTTDQNGNHKQPSQY